MTYFADLTPYTYSPFDQDFGVPTLNVGWLDVSQPHVTGVTSAEFQKKLLDFCVYEHTVIHCFGFHTCEYCDDLASHFASVPHPSGKPVTLGNGEIRVIGKSAIYAAPTLIFHYVTVHNYKPPDEFVEAVLNGPGPGSEEHQAILAKLQH